MVSESGQRAAVEAQSSALPVVPPARDEPPEVEQLPGPEAQPQIIEPEEEEAQADASNVLAFPAPAKPKRGRKRKSVEDSFRVDHVKPSKGTWAFRIRWTEENGERPAAYVSRVSDDLFAAITSSRKTYGNFKKQLIASYLSRTVRRSDRTVSSAGRDV